MVCGQTLVPRSCLSELYTPHRLLFTDVGACSFFYFYIYSFLRMLSVKKLIPFTSRGSQSSKSHKATLVEELVLGFIAGVASRAVSTPLNIITLRTQTTREQDEDEGEGDVSKARALRPANSGGLTDIVKLIYKEQGLAGFWRG